MVPEKTFEKVPSAVGRAAADYPSDEYVIRGTDLRDLAVLAQRFNYRFDDANEMRDWQNRISLILMNAMEVS